MRLLAATVALWLVPFVAQAASAQPVALGEVLSERDKAVAEIGARRIAYNSAIAARRADLMAGFITDDMAEMVSSGAVNKGRAVVIADYEAVEFKDPDFAGYDRRTDSVEVDATGIVAAERGHWRARVRDTDGQLVEIGGPYQAGWIRRDGSWLIRTESYIITICRPAGGCR